MPVTLLASICSTTGPAGAVTVETVAAGAVTAGVEDVVVAEAGKVATPVSAPDCGTISIAQICGFSIFGVKVILMLLSVTSTGTVST